MQKVYLASTSSWRLELLRNTGLSAEAVGSNVDESAIVHSDPIQVARLRAHAKAQAVYEKVEKKSKKSSTSQRVRKIQKRKRKKKQKKEAKHGLLNTSWGRVRPH